MKAGFKFNPKQIELLPLLAEAGRHSMLVGGARSSKTFFFLFLIMLRACKAAGSRHLVTRFRYNHVKKSVWLDTLPKVVDLCFPELRIPERNWNKSDLYLTLPNGSEIWMGGLDEKERVDAILGLEFATIFFNECSQISWHAVTTALTRLAQKCTAVYRRESDLQLVEYILPQKAYYDLNPVGRGHWTSQLFINGMSPETHERIPNPQDYFHAFINPIDNRENLSEEFIDSLKNMPERQRKRFYEGLYISEVEGALFPIELLEKCHVALEDVRPLRRIVVAIDPSGARGEFDIKADEIGMVAAGIDEKEHGYILEDASGLYSPEEWGKRAVDLYDKWNADLIVGENNFGGDMVRAVVHQADKRKLPFKAVNASRGKHVRAEPVSQQYALNRVSHVGRFAVLEEELNNFTTAGYPKEKGSPNHADAAVWALTELFGLTLSLGLVEYLKQASMTAHGLAIKPEAAAPLTIGPQAAPAPVARSTAPVARATFSDLMKPARADNAIACTMCKSQAVTKIGGIYRCNDCGHNFQLSGVVVKPASRADLFK